MKNRDKLTLGAMLLLFAFPPLGAYILYFGDAMPTGTSNNGTLIQPIIAINHQSKPISSQLSSSSPQLAAKSDFLERWNMVLLHEKESCDQECQKNIYLMRQVQIALGKDSHRLRRIILLNGLEKDLDFQLFLDHFPRLKQRQSNQELRNLFTEVTDSIYQRVFIVDPFGNLMMYYPHELEPKDLLSDLKRLIMVNRS